MILSILILHLILNILILLWFLRRILTEVFIVSLLSSFFIHSLLHWQQKHKSILILIIIVQCHIYNFRVLLIFYGLWKYYICCSGAHPFGYLSYFLFFLDFLQNLLLIHVLRIILDHQSRSWSEWFKLHTCGRRTPSSSLPPTLYPYLRGTYDEIY